MPVLDGFGFLKRLKAAGKCYDKTKVYMLTSSLRESDREQAMSYDCVVDYLEKPLTEEAINKIFK
jgi:CheY-like chemotaxis protein